MQLRVELERLLGNNRENWLARNRPGDLQDSLARFAPMLDRTSDSRYQRPYNRYQWQRHVRSGYYWVTVKALASDNN